MTQEMMTMNRMDIWQVNTMISFWGAIPDAGGEVKMMTMIVLHLYLWFQCARFITREEIDIICHKVVIRFWMMAKCFYNSIKRFPRSLSNEINTILSAYFWMQLLKCHSVEDPLCAVFVEKLNKLFIQWWKSKRIKIFSMFFIFQIKHNPVFTRMIVCLRVAYICLWKCLQWFW